MRFIGGGKMVGRRVQDVVIVGAGAAGLAAAGEAQRRRLRFTLFEAMDRIGGRAFTDSTRFGVPWDVGCHWLHSASINPLRALADKHGFRYLREPVAWEIRGEAGAALPPDRLEALESSVARCHQAVMQAGSAERDVPVSSVLDPDEPGLSLFHAELHAEWGVGAERVSTLDAARYRDTGENWPVVDGYGALIRRIARGLPVELSTPVKRIEWQRSPVRVVTPRGTLETDTVLITVSTNVLASGQIVFDPPLPNWKAAAAAALPLGSANKVAFAIAGKHLGVEQHTSVAVPVLGAPMVFFQLRPFGWDLANGYLAGPLGGELEKAGEEAMFETMLAALADALGSNIRRRVSARACSRWAAVSSIMGAYAAALPGQTQERARLRQSIDGQLYFAGEAMHPEFFSTCHGAHLTGIDAILEIAGSA